MKKNKKKSFFYKIREVIEFIIAAPFIISLAAIAVVTVGICKGLDKVLCIDQFKDVDLSFSYEKEIVEDK